MVPNERLQHSISLLLRYSGRQVLVGQVVEIVVANDANHRIVRPGKTLNGTFNKESYTVATLTVCEILIQLKI
jgi:hypothetical protein